MESRTIPLALRDVQAIINLFIKLYRDSGINGASSHSGRRTAITLMADHSINARVIQAFARHSHLNSTQRYIDINASKVNKALASVFG
jgi:integrase/recombinase XerD